MRLNKATPSIRTHEGAVAQHISVEAQLRRSMMCFMLWEDQFYESGEEISKRIAALIPQCDPLLVSQLAVEARSKMNLRHAPLFIVNEMVKSPKHKGLVSETLYQVIQRADELSEFLAIYWKDGKKKLSAQVKKGLRRAFGKFNEYQLGKYNRDNAIKLRDVMFLVHPKPKDDAQAEVFKKLASKTLETPETWEVAISETKGENKKEAWEALLKENKMGCMALIRNLRNFIETGVDENLVRYSLTNAKADRVLPFRFISAAKYGPKFEPELEQLMFKCLAEKPKLLGQTLLLVDVSSSMDSQVSGKSEITRVDAAYGLAMLIRELGQCAVFTFSDQLAEVPPRRGFGLKDAMHRSQNHNGTELGSALNLINSNPNRMFSHDRIIVITDEQSHDRVPAPVCKNAYMINVASYQNGVGYNQWTHIDGWSEAVVDFIMEIEKEKQNGI